MNNQLRTGIKIEREHKKTINFIRKYAKKHKGNVPSNKTIFKSIAKDHITEHKDYYTRLKKAKL